MISLPPLAYLWYLMMNQGEWLEAVRRFLSLSLFSLFGPFQKAKIREGQQQQQLLMRQLGWLSVTASQGATFFRLLFCFSFVHQKEGTCTFISFSFFSVPFDFDFFFLVVYSSFSLFFPHIHNSF